MAIFRTLKVQNGLSYRDLSVDFDQQGLVLIDAIVGGGKSSLFDLLTHVLYGQTPRHGIRDNDIINRYCLDNQGNPHGYRGEVCWSALGHEYRMVQERRNEGRTGVALTEDGKNINIKTGRSENLDTQKLVASKVGYNLREFFGGVYLTQGHTHDLVVGRPSERSQYLIRFFGIDRLDGLILSYKDKVASSAADADFSSLDAQLNVIDEEIQQRPEMSMLEQLVQDQRAQIEQREQTQKRLRTSYEKLIGDQARHTSYVAARSVVEAHPLHGQPQANDELRVLRDQQAQLRARIDRLTTNQRLVQQLKAETKLDDPAGHQVKLDDQKRLLQDYQADQSVRFKIKTLEGQVSDAQWDPAMGPMLDQKKSQLAAQTASIQGIRDELVKIERLGDVCFTCLRAIDPAEKSSMVDTRKQALETHQASIRKLQGLVTAMDQQRSAWLADEGLRQQARILRDTLRGSPEDVNISDVKAAISGLDAALQSHARYVTLEARLYDCDDSLDLSELQQIRDRQQQRIGELTEYQKLLDAVPEAVADQTEKISGVGQMIADAERELSDLRIDHARNQDSLRELSRLQDRRRRIQQDRAEKQAIAAKHRILHTTHLALKDIRGLRLHEATSMLVRQLPEYLSLLFHGEDIKVDVEDREDSCDIVLHKTGQSIELTALSMGQQRKLGLAIVFALTGLVNRQSNMLVLDEPYSNLDAKSRGACYEILRDLMGPDRRNPTLTSCFVMSHDQDLKNQRFDQRWTIDYDGKESKLRR